MSSQQKTFKELADLYLKNESINIDEDGTIKSVEIIGSNNEIFNFNINHFGYDNERSILLHFLNIYNMYIKAYNICENTQNEAIEKCMSINRIFENNTGESSSQQHGPCSNIFEFVEKVSCLEKNHEKKRKILELIKDVKKYLDNNNNKIKTNQNGGKFKTKKTRSYKRKTNKRKKTKSKRKKTKARKTNKRIKTKSKTNKRKKRTRRRR
jgi:hypothetical protein